MKTTKPRLFIDACVFIAGAASETGGSSVIFKFCHKGSFQAVTTELILQEVRKNIKNKFGVDVLKRFYKIVSLTSLERCPPATTTDKYKEIIELKDAHVLAAAIESKSAYLLTLDMKHFFTPAIKKAKLPIKIVTPKDFIQEQYKT